MRIGLLLTSRLHERDGLDRIVAAARTAEADGFATLWVNSASSGTFGLDALALLAVVGREVGRVELGTAIVPTWPHHPIALAQQALAAQAVSGGRLVLGVGPSHRASVEGSWGYPFDDPVGHTREYLTVLAGLLRGEVVDFRGERLRARGQLADLGLPPVPVLLSALGPRMLALAGRLAAGTITWLAGPNALATHVVPTIQEAARAAVRPAPRIVAGLPVCVTEDAAVARARLDAELADHAALASYRKLLEREGASGPGGVALVGDEAAVAAQLETLAAAGATDLMVAESGTPEERARTRAFFRARLGAGGAVP